MNDELKDNSLNSYLTTSSHTVNVDIDSAYLSNFNSSNLMGYIGGTNTLIDTSNAGFFNIPNTSFNDYWSTPQNITFKELRDEVNKAKLQYLSELLEFIDSSIKSKKEAMIGLANDEIRIYRVHLEGEILSLRNIKSHLNKRISLIESALEMN